MFFQAVLEPSKRTVRIRITPAPDPQASIDIDVNDGQGFQCVLDFAAPQPVPDSYRFGFAASTGLFTDVHLIRNLTVSTLTPLEPNEPNEPNTVPRAPRTRRRSRAFAGQSNKSLVRVHVGQHQHHRSANSTRQNGKSFHRLFARSADRRR